MAAEIGGETVQAWSSDVALHDAPEAWPTAFCLPAARNGVALAVPLPVAPAWRTGAEANVAMTSSWWGGDDQLSLVEPGLRWPRPRRRRLGQPEPQAPGRALCFTGGVDSFFSLLSSGHAPTHLLFVVGYDVDLDDAERVSASVAAVRDVAAELGVAALIVSTDLRTHPNFASISWEHTHGAALATIGHLLHRTIGALVIPPSYAASRLVPWGSRPDLDANWGVPGRLDVVHGDASGRRIDRLRAIASHPLVHRHLRVCWHNVAGTLNCGVCEKCVRTMVMLAGADQLQHCATFPDRAALPGALDRIPRLDEHIVPVWTDLVDLGLRADERASFQALLTRST